MAVANFAIATNFVYTDASGVKQEKVEFHEIVTWRRLAEIAAQYLKKGAKVFIEGRLQTRSWEDQNGAKRYRTEIVAENLIMLDRAPVSSYQSAPTGAFSENYQRKPASGAPFNQNPSSLSRAPFAKQQEPMQGETGDGIKKTAIEDELPTIDRTEETEEEVKVEEIPF